MTSWGGIAVGAAGLAVAEAVLSKPTGASRVGGIGTSVAKVIADFLSVGVPGLPKKTQTQATLTATTTTTTSSPPSSSAAPYTSLTQLQHAAAQTTTT